MTEVKESRDSFLLVLNDLITSDEKQHGQEPDDVVLDGLPPSLLRYFETSKTRAVVCEKLLLEEAEDDYIESEEINKCDAEHERHHRGEAKKEEQRRQRDTNFQEELNEIIETKKLHQMELQLKEKIVQDRLQQEMLIQQEIISDLQNRVQRERRMIEEEQRRQKEEEERKVKMKEEKRKKEEEDKSKRMEEEGERKPDLGGLKKEWRERQEDKRRKSKVEQNRREDVNQKMEEEMRREVQEDERKTKEVGEVLCNQTKGSRGDREAKREKEKKQEAENKNKSQEMKIQGQLRGTEKETEKQEQQNEDEKDKAERMKMDEGDGIKKKDDIIQLKACEVKWKDEERQSVRGKDVMRKEEIRRGRVENEDRNTKEEIKVKVKTETSEDSREMKYERQTGDGEKKTEALKLREKDVLQKKDGTKKLQMEIMLNVEEVKHDEETMRGEMRLTEYNEKEKRMIKKQLHKAHFMKLQIKNQDSTECWSHSNTGPSVSEVTVTRSELVPSVSEVTVTRSELVPSVSEVTVTRSELVPSVSEVTVTRSELVPSVSEVTVTRSELVPSVSEVTVTRSELVPSVSEVTVTRSELVPSVSEVTVTRSELVPSVSEVTVTRSELVPSVSEVTVTRSELVPSVSEVTVTRSELVPSVSDALKTCSELGISVSETMVSLSSSETPHLSDKRLFYSSGYKTLDQPDLAEKPSTFSWSSSACLPALTEQKRLSWMRDCVPWTKLSFLNRRKLKDLAPSRRGPRKPAETCRRTPLSPIALLQSSGCRNLQEVTTVTLENLPECSLSTLLQCCGLRSLTLRHCGLRSLEGINQLQQLCYIDVQENDISFVDCENMTSLRVLQLAHNKLTSIHGLTGAENVDVLDLSHNSITRIAGLESLRRLQRLSMDHNQLISTKGLRDVYTLLHLNCSHNHLARVEGLENSALLHSLDLRANSLTEFQVTFLDAAANCLNHFQRKWLSKPPSLNNQVLLRELRLDDNNISSLNGLADCWLPLLHRLSATQNRLTQLPHMTDFVSLENLDLRFNYLSEIQNVCENLEGCPFLQEVHLSGNPLQQESGWRSLLQKSVHALKATENQQPGSFLSSVSLDPGSFLAFCQAQLQQTRDLQQCHSRELSEASCSLHTLESFLRQLALTLKLAEDQRVAHEYGEAAAQFTPGSMLDMDGLTLEVDYTDVLSWGDVRVSRYQHKESPTEDGVTADPRTGRSTPDNSYKVPGSSYQDSDLKNTAAVMIQQQWKKYRQKCGNINDTRQDRKKPELRASSIHSRTADEDYAATVIQAFWRGSSLRRRLASALTAATSLDTGEDDTFEEVDVEEFVFDEPALEKHWTLTLPEDSFPRHLPESPKPPVSGHNHSQHKPPPPLFLGSPKQAWIAEQPVDVAAQISSPEICNYRSKSPASTSGLRGLSERSEKILEEWGFTDSRTALLMLKRAQKMKSTKQQRKHGNSSVHPALFRNCNNQPGPADARNRLLRHQQCLKAGAKAEQGLQRTKMIRREGAQTRAVGSDGRSESKRFLPEMNPSILSGGRVLLVAYTSCSDCPETAGPWDSSGLVSQHGQASVRSCRNSWGHLRQEVLPPERVASAPSKNKRISFRDNPVQLSGGWGGGRKRDTWHK